MNLIAKNKEFECVKWKRLDIIVWMTIFEWKKHYAI